MMSGVTTEWTNTQVVSLNQCLVCILGRIELNDTPFPHDTLNGL